MQLFFIFTLLVWLFSYHYPFDNFMQRINGPSGKLNVPAVEVEIYYDVHPKKMIALNNKIFPKMNQYKPMLIPDNLTSDSDTCGLTLYEDNGMDNGEWTNEELNISISQLQNWIVRRSLTKDNLWGLWNIITFGTRLFSIQFTLCIALLALLKSLYNFNWSCKLQVVSQNAMSQGIDLDQEEEDDDDDDDEYFLTEYCRYRIQETDDDDTTSEEYMDCLESLPHDQEAGEQLNAEHETISQSSEEQHNDMEIGDTSEVSDISAPLSGSSLNDQEIREHLASKSKNDVVQFIEDLEEAVDNMREDRVALFVPSAINREAEEYLQTMYPSVKDILCSLHKKSEEYTQAEQDDDDNSMQDTSLSDQESGELQANPEDIGITDSTTSHEFVTLTEVSETQSEYMSSIEDLQDGQEIEHDYIIETELKDTMQRNLDNVTLDEELELQSKDTSANGGHPQDTDEFENQSDTEYFESMCNLAHESASLDISTTESTGSNEIIPKTVNLDGSIKLVLYTPDGEPCILNCTVITDG